MEPQILLTQIAQMSICVICEDLICGFAYYTTGSVEATTGGSEDGSSTTLSSFFRAFSESPKR